MITVENVFSLAIIASFFVVAIFGCLAWFQIDQKKKNEATGKIITWGPLVSGQILTDKGKRFALVRSIGVVSIVALAIGFLIFAALRKG